jgi:dolichol-phosphate mannosyltransferase
MGAWVGFRQFGLPYERAPRQSGESTYDMRRMIRLAIDGALSFSTRPLALMAQFGFLVTVIAFLAGVWLVVERLTGAASVVPGWTSVIVAVLFMGGVQLLSLGVLGAYIGRVFYETKRRPLYLVAERFGGEDDDLPA